jgi:hypothetical protein
MCRRRLRRTRRKFADFMTMVFLFVKQLQRKEYIKRIIQFFAVFFFTTACCVARKSYSGTLMILPQLVERKST